MSRRERATARDAARESELLNLRLQRVGSSTVPEAPVDGEEYVRKNGDWAVASGGGGGSGNSYNPGGW